MTGDGDPLFAPLTHALALFLILFSRSSSVIRTPPSIFGLEAADTEMRITEMKVPPHLIDALAGEIERYEKSLKAKGGTR